MLPGQNWRAEIPKAIKDCQVCIACFSELSVTKKGYVQKEFRMALDEYSRRPPSSIYLIPLRLDNCTIPDLHLDDCGVKLRDLQRVDLYQSDGFNRLIKALNNVSPDSRKESLSRFSNPSTPQETTSITPTLNYEIGKSQSSQLGAVFLSYR
ncbi:MAG: toll/interleukin-1 receptor domain-containing protein, partial [Cyanobacteria bacterium J06555_13]